MKKRDETSREWTEGEIAFSRIELEHADLHTHSHYSDGCFSVPEVLQKSKERGAKVVSLTDHDGVGGLEEARDTAEQLRDLVFVPGVEFSVEGPEGEELHVLGYFMNWENPSFRNMVEWVRTQRQDRNRRLFQVMTREGYPISEEDFSGISNYDYIGKPLIARKMVEKGYIKDSREAFSPGRFFESENWKEVKKKKLSSKEAVEKIRQAGGAAVLAHPVKIKQLGEPGTPEFWGVLEQLLGRLQEQGLYGLECYYPEHTSDEVARLLALAEKLGLKASKGSDFHGCK